MSITKRISKTNVDNYRDQIDSLSYNMKKIFCEDSDGSGISNKPLEFAELAIRTVDDLVKLTSQLTHLEITDTDLPKINSIISSYRWLAHELESAVESVEGNIAEEYMAMYKTRIGDLTECASDLDITYFQLRNDDEYNDLISELGEL